MRLKLETRAEPSRVMGYLSPLLAAVLTVIAGFILFSALGKNPLQAFYTFFIYPVHDLNGFAELLLKASPLMLIGVGLACGYRANVWNIGAEGQLVLGAIFAGGVALYFHGSESSFILPAMVVAGALGGMLWAAIPALLRTRFNTNEILVSLMLVYVANFLLSWLVHEPWRDPEGFNFPQSKQFTEAALYPVLIQGTRLNVGFLISLAAIGLGYVFLNRSFLGFQMRVAVNSLAILEREGRLGPAADARERERLMALLGHDGTLEDLNRELARQIRKLRGADFGHKGTMLKRTGAN